MSLPNTTKLGPIHEHIHQTLLSYPFYQDFLAGRLDAHQYAEQVLALGSPELPPGVAAGDLPFASRFPADRSRFVQEVLTDLSDRGYLPTSTYDEADYRVYADKTQALFQHPPQGTYIAAEEAQLLYALTQILQPRNVAFLGSYYGYWAHWSLPSIQAVGGQAQLVDVDAEVLALAQQNIDNFGFSDTVNVVLEDAIAFCQRATTPFDMVVIDAECPRDHPNPDHRGKAIYVPILEAVLPKMAPGSVLIFHNIIFQHFHPCPFFDDVLARNHQEIDSLLPLLAEHTLEFLEYESTEGIGIGFLPA